MELLNSVSRDGIDELLKWLEESDFFNAPALHAYHGSYIGGLCEHSLNVYDETQRLLKACGQCYGCSIQKRHIPKIKRVSGVMLQQS